MEVIANAVAALGPGPLTEQGIRRHLEPLFTRHRQAFGKRSYLANHSLGRPLDATRDDVEEGLAAWYAALDGAWDAWSAEMDAHRQRLAQLLRTPRANCVVPKTSAGQGLRAVLNALESGARIVATRGEFDTLDLILREYARRGRIALTMVEPRADGQFATPDIVAAIAPGCDLVVVSEVMFTTGQRLANLDAIVAAAHGARARVLVDVYHSLGVLPVDVAALDADFAVGGSYKYLRGGPGACFLYIAPRVLEAGLMTLDTGWFAKEATFAYLRPDPPRFAAGGDAWLESTPPVLTYFQARAGANFTLAIGVGRLREYSLAQQRMLVDRLAAHGIAAEGGSDQRGAFVVVRHASAGVLCQALAELGIVTDARGEWLRLGPDLLTTGADLQAAADAMASVLRSG